MDNQVEEMRGNHINQNQDSETNTSLLKTKFDVNHYKSTDVPLKSLKLSDYSEESKIMDLLYKDFTCTVTKTISRNERESKNMFSSSLVYGEIEFSTAVEIYSLIRSYLSPTFNFIDLGSGNGKVCFSFALLYNFNRIIGIEILSDLKEVASLVLKQFIQVKVAQLKANNHHFPQMPTNKGSEYNNYPISFIEGNLKHFDWWSDNDVVFINSTCFEETLLAEITKKADLLKPGSIVITMTWSLDSDKFFIMHQKSLNMSWGKATVIIQRRKQEMNKYQKFPVT